MSSTDDAAQAAAEPGPARNRTAEEIERDIERTRTQLGETAGALAHKLDAKAQAKEKAHQAQQAGRDLYRERPALVIAVAASSLAALVLGAVLWRRNG